jgi:hypothetical protein
LAAASGFISGGFEGTKPEFSAGRAEESWKQQTNELIKRVSNFTEGSLAGYQEDSSSSALLFRSLQDGSGALDFSVLAGKPGDWGGRFRPLLRGRGRRSAASLPTRECKSLSKI